MIKLNLDAGQSDLLRTLLKDEETRLAAEGVMYVDSEPVSKAIAHDLRKVRELQLELLDAIMCAHPE